MATETVGEERRLERHARDVIWGRIDSVKQCLQMWKLVRMCCGTSTCLYIIKSICEKVWLGKFLFGLAEFRFGQVW